MAGIAVVEQDDAEALGGQGCGKPVAKRSGRCALSVDHDQRGAIVWAVAPIGEHDLPFIARFSPCCAMLLVQHSIATANAIRDGLNIIILLG